MKNKKHKTLINPGQRFSPLEFVLFITVLSLLTLRTTFTEGPNPQFAAQMRDFIAAPYSLTVSTILIAAFATWLIKKLISKND